MSTKVQPLAVRNEVGRLRRALVHEPGPEVDRMVPAMMEELLFDDILYGDRARHEHGRFRRVLQLGGIEVLDARDLLAETLQIEEARDQLLDGLLEEVPRDIAERLREQPPGRLADFLIAGLRHEDGASGMGVEDLYIIPPLPNYCFQRDTQVILGDGVVFTSMAAPARQRESFLARTVFSHHPDFKQAPVHFDPFQAASSSGWIGQLRPNLEGGDVLVLSEDVLAVGLSERTNRVGIRVLARALARIEGGPRWILVVDVPRRRAYMHLDTLLTAIDRDLCLAFPPVIYAGGAEEAQTFSIDLHAKELRFSPAGPVLPALKQLGIDLEPISCGGDDLVSQQREQWTDGSNSLALAPGVITLFDRNTVTAEELSKRGFEVVDSEDLLLGRTEADIDSGKRLCILLRSHEISRARGGPHCLLHPLNRDA